MMMMMLECLLLLNPLIFAGDSAITACQLQTHSPSFTCSLRIQCLGPAFLETIPLRVTGSPDLALAKCPRVPLQFVAYGSVLTTYSSSLALLQDVLPLTEESPKEEALAEQAEHPLED